MNTTRRPLVWLAAVLLGLAAPRAHAQSTDGRVTYTVSTVNYNGGYDPKHVCVVWLVDSNGTFVKTLCRHAGTRINYLYKWIASRGSYTGVDGVTSATLTSQPQTHTVVWDCRGTNGLIAADGVYDFRAEYTSSNAQGPCMSNNCRFVKGAAAVSTNFPAYSNASGQFTSLSLTYTPYNEVAVTGLAPSTGVINSNVAVVVSVTNQTWNTLTFSVAVSNVTSGTLIGTQPVAALPGRALTNLTVAWSTAGLTAGAYQVRAVASALATETNSANNAFTGSITLTSAAAGDLAVTAFTPAYGLLDSTVPLRLTVTNKTSSPAAAFAVSVSNLTAATTALAYSNAWRVAASADDAEENLSTRAVSLTSTDLELVIDTASQAVGVRFANLAIPPGASIQSAFIQFTDKTGENLNTDPIALTIAGQAADTAAAFTTAASNITARPATSAQVAWSPPVWADAAAGPDQRTPDLKAVLQEIVGRPGWASGNAAAFKLTGSGSRRAWSYDGSAANAAQLVVQWTQASRLVATQQVASLAAFAATNLTALWNTAGVTAGVYRLVAQAGPLASETYTPDNTRTNDLALRPAVRDLALHTFALPAFVPPNIVTNIQVTVTNRGDLAETFTNTLFDVTAAPLVLATRVVTNLAAAAGTNVLLVWNTATNAAYRLGPHALRAEIAAVAGEADLSNNAAVAQTVLAPGLAVRTLVAANAAWRYHDKGLDLSGAPWTTADYYDGFWSAGPSPLGYTLTNIATAVSYGGVASNRYLTTYFRQAFILDHQPLSVTARVMRADGAALYLNGREVARHNLPAGPLGYATLALSAVTGTNAVRYYDVPLAPSNFVAGRNLFAAELHLSVPNREAAGFSLDVSSVAPAVPAEPALTPSALTPDGPAQAGDAAGVSVTLSNTGNAAADGLVLIRDAATGALLGRASAGPLAPGESTTVRVTLATFGAATGSRTLQAVTVVGGVTNLASVATAPFALAAPAFTPRASASAGSLGGRCNAVAAAGATAFLGCGATLEAWDVSAPAAPARRALLRLPGLIEDLAATNGWVYAACGAAGVQVVEAPAATQLVLRATYDTTGHARRLALAGSTLYVADALGGVRALSVAAPASPALAGAYATTGPAQALADAAPRLLVLDAQRGLQNLHASSPAALALTGAYSRVTAGLALAAAPVAAFVADANGGLLRLSTASPTNLTAVTNAQLPAAAVSLAAAGPALYAAAGAQGLLTRDAATLAARAATDLGGDASDVAVYGGVLYAAAGFGGARSFSLADPFAPAPLGVFDTAVRGSDAAALGSTLYVAGGESGLQIVRLQDLARPQLLGIVNTLASPRCVAVSGRLLLVGDGLDGLKVYDLTVPTAPILLGTYAASNLSHLRRIAAAGRRAALTDGKRVELLSLDDPAQPALLASAAPGGFVFDLAAVTGHVYAACGGAGLIALSMDALSTDASLATPGPATGVAAGSNRLSVACGPAGWQTYTLDNPASPVLAQTTPGRFVFDAAAAGHLVYLADGARTALVANVSAPLEPVAQAAFGDLSLALRVRAAQGLLVTAEDEAGIGLFAASPGDLNLNGVPDEWEQQIVSASVLTNGPVRSVLDIDLQSVGPNGHTYYQSYLAGLTPTDPNSVLALSAVAPEPAAPGQLAIQWRSVPGKRYTLCKSSSPAGPFEPIPAATALLATGALTGFTDTLTGPRAFYLVILAP